MASLFLTYEKRCPENQVQPNPECDTPCDFSHVQLFVPNLVPRLLPVAYKRCECQKKMRKKPFFKLLAKETEADCAILVSADQKYHSAAPYNFCAPE